jgi:hypothetical protein
MVKVYPFRALHPTADEETLLHPDNPNRFAVRNISIVNIAWG